MRLIRALAAAAATFASSVALGQSYTVHELPAKPPAGAGSLVNSGAMAIDSEGRTLIWAQSTRDDGSDHYQGEMCGRAAMSCTRLRPNNAFWTAVSSDATHVAGSTLTLAGESGWALLAHSSGSVKRLFWGGEARSVNKHGVVVGNSDWGTVAWSFSDQKHILPTLPGGQAQATAINDNGWIAGSSKTVAGEWRAVIWKDGAITELEPDIPPGHNYNTRVFALSHAGVAYGTSGGSGSEYSARFEGGRAIYLGSLGGDFANRSGVTAVNNLGVVVGWSFNFPEPSFEAVRFDPGRKVVALSSLIPEEDRAKYRLLQAWGVNDAGQIVVTALRQSDFSTVALRLDPVSP